MSRLHTAFDSGSDLRTAFARSSTGTARGRGIQHLFDCGIKEIADTIAFYYKPDDPCHTVAPGFDPNFTAGVPLWLDVNLSGFAGSLTANGKTISFSSINKQKRAYLLRGPFAPNPIDYANADLVDPNDSRIHNTQEPFYPWVWGGVLNSCMILYVTAWPNEESSSCGVGTNIHDVIWQSWLFTFMPSDLGQLQGAIYISRTICVGCSELHGVFGTEDAYLCWIPGDPMPSDGNLIPEQGIPPGVTLGTFQIVNPVGLNPCRTFTQIPSGMLCPSWSGRVACGDKPPPDNADCEKNVNDMTAIFADRITNVPGGLKLKYSQYQGWDWRQGWNGGPSCKIPSSRNFIFRDSLSDPNDTRQCNPDIGAFQLDLGLDAAQFGMTMNLKPSAALVPGGKGTTWTFDNNEQHQQGDLTPLAAMTMAFDCRPDGTPFCKVSATVQVLPAQFFMWAIPNPTPCASLVYQQPLNQLAHYEYRGFPDATGENSHWVDFECNNIEQLVNIGGAIREVQFAINKVGVCAINITSGGAPSVFPGVLSIFHFEVNL